MHYSACRLHGMYRFFAQYLTILSCRHYPNTKTLSDRSTISSKSDIVEIGQTALSPLPRTLRQEPHAYIAPFNALNSETFAAISKSLVSGMLSNSEPSLIRKIST